MLVFDSRFSIAKLANAVVDFLSCQMVPVWVEFRVPLSLFLLLLFFRRDALPKARVTLNLDFEQGSTVLKPVDEVFRQVHRVLDLHESAKLALVVLKVKTAVIWVSLDEGVEPADTDVLHAQIVFSAASNLDLVAEGRTS